MVTGDSLGNLSLYKYMTRSRMVTKKTPAVPNLKNLLKIEGGKLYTTYVTRPQIHESLVGVSALKFSPTKGYFGVKLEKQIWFFFSLTGFSLIPFYQIEI